MPIEIRLEFNSMVIDTAQVNPGQTDITPFYDNLQSTVHLPICEDDDQGGRIIVAEVDLEDCQSGTLVPLAIRRNVPLEVGARYIDFIDISDRMIIPDRSLNIAQLVIEHKLSEE